MIKIAYICDECSEVVRYMVSWHTASDSPRDWFTLSGSTIGSARGSSPNIFCSLECLKSYRKQRGLGDW